MIPISTFDMINTILYTVDAQSYCFAKYIGTFRARLLNFWPTLLPSVSVEDSKEIGRATANAHVRSRDFVFAVEF